MPKYRSVFRIALAALMLFMPASAETVNKTTSPEFAPYMDRLKVMVKRHWQPPKVDCKTRCVVNFTINSSGQLLSLRVDSSSGNPQMDVAGLEAVKATVPFEALPKGTPEQADIKFAFDYDPKFAPQNGTTSRTRRLRSVSK